MNTRSNTGARRKLDSNLQTTNTGLPPETDWRPPSTLPDLSRFSELWVDTETTGTDRFKDRPVGLAVAAPDGSSFYLPTGHAGGNLDADQVRRWANRNLRDKTLIGSWMKFDAHMFRNWGLPLDDLNVKLRDVQHQACLLNEKRRKSGLDLLAKEILGKQKLELPPGVIDRMARVHSSVVGPYAEQDVILTRELDLAQRPMIIKEDLQQVLELEDSIIFCVVEMEANGMPIDVPKMERWRVEVRQQYEQGLKDLQSLAGFAVNPGSAVQLKKLFKIWGLEPPIDIDKNTPTFAAPYLQLIKHLHPGVPLLMRVKVLGGLLSKFLDKYAESVGSDGKLRYNLHQLRADEYGTITGRFSAAGDEHGGINPQQVFHPENQTKKLGRREFIIRELYIPESGLWVSADAAQIEYRLFAGLAGNPEVLAAYAADPETDYHELVTQMARRTALPDATRKKVKNVNFAKIYRAGIPKIARMLEVSVDAAREFVRAYDRMFPEVVAINNKVEAEIKRRYRTEGIGYVKTILGRRRRYPTLDRIHSGMNAHIQGTAADINKIKLRQVYDERKFLEITMRCTVHDELDGDITTRAKALQLRELLNEPALPGLPVPIRWATGTGPNWAEVDDLPNALPEAA